MKKLYLFLLLLFFRQPALSQNPLEWFDTARCHFATSSKIPIHSYPICFSPKISKMDWPDQKVPYTLWEKKEDQFIILEKGSFEKLIQIKVPKEGFYLMVLQDVRIASLIVIQAKPTRIEVKAFWNCVLHY